METILQIFRNSKSLLIVCSVSIIALYTLIFPSVADFINSFDKCEFIFCDFGRHYYHAGLEIVETGRPAGGFYYSPFFALLLAPVSMLGFSASLKVWGVFQLASILLLLLPAYFWFKSKRPNQALLYPILFFTSFPVLHNLKWGQVSTFITASVLLSLFLSLKGKTRASALILGLAASIKFYPIMFIPLFFRKNFILWLIWFLSVLIVLLILVPVVFLGFQTSVEFYLSIYGGILGASDYWFARLPSSQFYFSVLKRYFGQSEISLLLISVFRCLVLAAAAWLLIKDFLRRGSKGGAEPLYCIVLFLLIPFLLKSSWPHYFVYLPFAQAYLLLFTAEKLRQEQGVLCGLILALVISSILLSSLLLLVFLPSGLAVTHWGLIFMSDVLLLAAALSMLCLKQSCSVDQSLSSTN